MTQVSDFVATIYHALGYGPDTCVTDPTGRPFYVVQGKPVLELFGESVKNPSPNSSPETEGGGQAEEDPRPV